LPFIDKATIASNHYYKHIDEKSFVRCFLLVIPIIGNMIIGIYDFSKKTQVGSRLQDKSLEEIFKMDRANMDKLCESFKVTTRDEYIKCMLISALKAEKFFNQDVDQVFHDMIKHFQDYKGALQPFVHEDIKAGRDNQDNTLLHEILKCTFLSPKAKGSAFGFIFRDGHDYLRDYLGTRTFGQENPWGNRPVTFPVVPWGNSLKKIFDTFSVKDKKDFFENSSDIDHRLNLLTGITKPKIT